MITLFGCEHLNVLTLDADKEHQTNDPRRSHFAVILFK